MGFRLIQTLGLSIGQNPSYNDPPAKSSLTHLPKIERRAGAYGTIRSSW